VLTLLALAAYHRGASSWASVVRVSRRTGNDFKLVCRSA
jgi:hypothetical protein